jgi:hypothetical protein
MRYNVVMDATKPTSLRIPDEIIAFAEEIAKAKEWSRAKVLVRSIECGLPLVGNRTLKGYQQNHDQAEANLIKVEGNNAEIATGGSAGVAADKGLVGNKRGVQKGAAGDRGKLLRGDAGTAVIEGAFTENPIAAPQMCAYTEYDMETGETYRCGRTVHGPKVKHTRGERV